MKTSINLLEDFVAVNELHQVDYPIVQLTKWNKQTEAITFDFCFPLNKTPEKLPENGVFIKKIESKQALFSRFNGNYNLSHRAWYDLYEQAQEEELPVKGFPIEVFKSNPKNGGIPLSWEAEIYLPVTP